MPEEMVADYDVRSPGSRTLVTVVATLAAVGAIIGLVLGASLLMRNTKVSTSIIDTGKSAQLIVNATSADIRLVEGKTDIVKVTAAVTSGLRKTDYQIGRRGDEIKVLSGCRSLISPGCGVKLTIAVPKGLPIIINTTSGDIDADGLSQGVLTVRSADGNIDAQRLSVDEFSAESRSGNIHATFADQPFAFKAITDSGNIAATVPTGKRTYAVTVRSKNGKVSSQIESDPRGAGFIRATTVSGDVSLRNR